MGSINNPSIGATAEVTDEDTVFGPGAAPITWTDLDLSSVIGSKAALVFLRVMQSSIASATIAFRQNGSGLDFYPGADKEGGAHAFDAVQNIWGICAVRTDANGIIEWIAQSAATTTVVITAYILE